MPQAKDAHALITYFTKKYQQHYDRQPVVNRYKARWGFDSILMDLRPAEVRELLDFYVDSGMAHNRDLEWFFYNYDKLKTTFDNLKVEREKNRVLREESRKRAEDWRKSGKQGITGN